MSPEAYTSQPAPTEETFAINQAAIAGDWDQSRVDLVKSEAEARQDAKFEALTVSDVSPDGQATAEKYLGADATREAASHAAAILAINQAAAAGNWDQSRVDLVKGELEAKQEVK